MTTYIHCISNSIICSIIVFEFLGRFYLLWTFLTSYIHCILNTLIYGLKFSHVATRFQRFWHDYNVHRIFNTLILLYAKWLWLYIGSISALRKRFWQGINTAFSMPLYVNYCVWISGAFLLYISVCDNIHKLHFQYFHRLN